MNQKIYDVFTFFNELDLLEIRLEILDQYVDYFVITECVETFSGLPKEPIFEQNKHLFEKYLPKIIHQVTQIVPQGFEHAKELISSDDMHPLNKYALENALISDNVPPGAVHWLKEFYQKELIKKPLIHIANENDIIFISDLDEIWNPDILNQIKETLKESSDSVIKLRQLPYVWYLNNRSSEPWAGTLVANYHTIRDNCLNHLRTPSKTKYTYLENGGWHFTFIGGPDRVRKKIESYGHQEYNNDNIKNDIENKIASNRDFIGRPFNIWVEETDLPEYLKINRGKYSNLFK